MSTFLKKIKHAYAERHEPESYVYLALHVWNVLLFVTLIVICTGISFGVWQFIAPPSRYDTSQFNGDGIIGFNNTKLSQLVEYFEARNDLYDRMMSE